MGVVINVGLKTIMARMCPPEEEKTQEFLETSNEDQEISHKIHPGNYNKKPN